MCTMGSQVPRQDNTILALCVQFHHCINRPPCAHLQRAAVQQRCHIRNRLELGVALRGAGMGEIRVGMPAAHCPPC